MVSKFEIQFFEKSNAKPAEKFLLSLSQNTIAKSLRTFDLLEDYGPIIGMPYIKKIKPSIYELRIKGKEEVRFLFTVRQKLILILHGFKKKQRKIPQKEIKLALKRLTTI